MTLHNLTTTNVLVTLPGFGWVIPPGGELSLRVASGDTVGVAGEDIEAGSTVGRENWLVGTNGSGAFAVRVEQPDALVWALMWGVGFGMTVALSVLGVRLLKRMGDIATPD